MLTSIERKQEGRHHEESTSYFALGSWGSHRIVGSVQPTTFTNTNLPRPEPTGTSYSFDIQTEDGQPVGTCSLNSPGCILFFNVPHIAITLPDIPDQYYNHETLSCTVKSTVTTGKFGCTTAKCQSVTYTATGDNDSDSDDAPCSDATGQVWILVTTQYYHWVRVGRGYTQYYDGGNGTLSH